MAPLKRMKGMDGGPVNRPGTTKGLIKAWKEDTPPPEGKRGSAADNPLSLSDIPGSPRRSRTTDPEYLSGVRKFVSTHKHKTFKNTAGATLTIADLDDTTYRGEEVAHVVNGWGKFYLPEVVTMLVFGKVEGLLCLCDQLVLMTCEDEKMYGYDGEELHEVASTLKQLFEEDITYPAMTSYYKGEAFKKMTENDWAKVKKGPVGKSLDRAHYKRVTANKARFLENLKSIRQHTGQDTTVRLPENGDCRFRELQSSRRGPKKCKETHQTDCCLSLRSALAPAP